MEKPFLCGRVASPCHRRQDGTLREGGTIVAVSAASQSRRFQGGRGRQPQWNQAPEIQTLPTTVFKQEPHTNDAGSRYLTGRGPVQETPKGYPFRQTHPTENASTPPCLYDEEA